MKSKLSWIFFVPFTVAAIFVKLAQVIMPDGALFGLSDMQLDYVCIACVAVIFLFALIFCLADRKISPYYIPHRNFAAGILGLILALLFAADGANRIYHIFGSGRIEVLDVIEAVLLALSAVVFVVLGLSHSFSNKESKRFALFNIMPALLCAVRMVRCFVGFTTISITLADVCRLVCYIFATLFFFNYAVALSLTQAKNAVKSCFIYGFPAVAALLSYAAAALISSFDVNEIFDGIDLLEISVMGLYIFAFVVELTIFVKDKDHMVVEGVDDVDYKELDEGREDMNGTGFVVTGLDDDERPDTPESSYLNTADTNDFLYQETTEDTADNAEVSSHNDIDDFITEVVNSPNDVSDQEGVGYSDRLDEIDKLIVEISEDLYG